jgi:KaiC/GvpD/RAD55 family RecA-like ATPase
VNINVNESGPRDVSCGRQHSSQNDRRLSGGIEELDHILGGGFPARRMFLIEGALGTGKTTLALQFFLAGAKNKEQGLYIAFSESDDEIRSVAESHHWDLHGIELQKLNSLGDRPKTTSSTPSSNPPMWNSVKPPRG